MTPFRPLTRFLAQLWFALDTASALRHGGVVSDRARTLCMNEPSHPTNRSESGSLAPAV